MDWPLHDAALAGFRRVIADGVGVGLGERARTMDPEVLSAMVDTTLERIGPVGFLSLFLQFVGTTELALADVTVPTLVLAGRHDESLAGNRATALAAALPTASASRRLRTPSSTTRTGTRTRRPWPRSKSGTPASTTPR